MRQNQTQPNHPIEDSPYHLHLFRKNEFLSLEGGAVYGSQETRFNLSNT